FVNDKKEKPFWSIAGRTGLLIPVRDADGRIVGLILRPDESDGSGKYNWLSSKRHGGAGQSPPPIHVPLFTGDRSRVRVTEGALKADITTALSGVLTVGLPGLSSRLLVKLLQRLGVKVVVLGFDADAIKNHGVARALVKHVARLRQRGFQVELET